MKKKKKKKKTQNGSKNTKTKKNERKKKKKENSVRIKKCKNVNTVKNYMNNLIDKTKSRIPHKHITHSCISQDEQGVQDVEVVINE